MSQKFHLNTCILRIHWLDIKLLGTDDFYFFILLIIFFQILLLEIARCLLPVYNFIFVFTQLTLNYLDRKSVV